MTQQLYRHFDLFVIMLIITSNLHNHKTLSFFFLLNFSWGWVTEPNGDNCDSKKTSSKDTYL